MRIGFLVVFGAFMMIAFAAFIISVIVYDRKRKDKF